MYRQMYTFFTNVHTLSKPVHTWMYHFRFSFLVCPAGWPVIPAGWPVISDWLLLGDTPIQEHQFNWYRALPSLAVTPSPSPCLCCAAGATAAAGSGAGAAAPSSPAQSTMPALTAVTTSCDEPPPLSLGVMSSSSSANLRVKNLGLGQQHRLGVLVIGGQYGLQVLGEPSVLHLCILVHHRALVLKCSSVDTVLGWNCNRVHDETMDVGHLIIFYCLKLTKYSPEKVFR